MTKIHKVVNYDHEIIKEKDFNDIYKDPDVIRMKRKEKFVDVWSIVMICIAAIGLAGLVFSSIFQWNIMMG